MPRDAGLHDEILALGPWTHPYTLAGLRTWEIAPHPQWPPDPKVFERRWTALHDVLRNVRGKRILDIGCGDGFFALRLAALGAEVTAIDKWPDAVRRGEYAASMLDVPVAFSVGTAYEPPTGDYDLALMLNVVQYLDRPLLVFQRLAQIAGQLCVWVTLSEQDDTPLESTLGPGGSEMWLPTGDSLEAMLAGAGFEPQRVGGYESSAIYLADRKSRPHPTSR